jgi:integrase
VGANSLSVEHPIAGDELRAIKRYLAGRTDRLPWLFLSERGQPLTRSSVQYLVRVAAERIGLLNVHPHTLRHSCGYCPSAGGPNTGIDFALRPQLPSFPRQTRLNRAVDQKQVTPPAATFLAGLQAAHSGGRGMAGLASC